MTLKLGVLLPTRGLVMGSDGPPSIEPLLSMAEQAEQAGLDSVWVGDSLTAKPRLEPLTTLTAVAMRTQRVRLGTAVMLAALRHPVSLAQASATVDTISGGRLILGAGVGGAFNDAQQQEWLNVGVKPSQRASRFEEVLEIATRLTRGEAVTFEGRHFNFNEVSVLPRAVQTNGVPFLVACHWRAGRERQFQRAARLGAGFMSISDYPDDYDRVRGYTASTAETLKRPRRPDRQPPRGRNRGDRVRGPPPMKPTSSCANTTARTSGATDGGRSAIHSESPSASRSTTKQERRL